MIRQRISVLLFSGLVMLGWGTLSGVSQAQTESVVNQRIIQNLGDPNEYKAFFFKFQQAVVASDRQAVASMLRYPFRFGPGIGAAAKAANPQQFLEHYDQVFTPSVVAAVKTQSYADLFVRDQGVSIGNGAVWFTGVCADKACSRRVVKVIAVNN